jgi:cyclomaltodextrin glucanotransferase
MTYDQPMYGEIYDADWTLLADHGNLHPNELSADNPLHAFYRRERDLAELSDMNYDNPAVLDYFVAAHSKWIEQGASAVRIDTIKHMPHAFWKAFADRIRREHPGLFMFAESWSFDAEFLAQHTFPENGGISVLDFPGREAMSAVFGKSNEPYTVLLDYLHLDSGVYQNPYDLMTFYDNHDMPRLDADNNGFIDANNWLFTSRGIPVVYYGSEIAFRAGTDQHKGNRDYFGQENIEIAKNHPLRDSLARIAMARKNSVALQRGLQVNLEFTETTAAFLRVYQKDEQRETALVLLNKADVAVEFDVGDWLFPARWQSLVGDRDVLLGVARRATPITVPAHGVAVYTSDAAIAGDTLLGQLNVLQERAPR